MTTPGDYADYAATRRLAAGHDVCQLCRGSSDCVPGRCGLPDLLPPDPMAQRRDRRGRSAVLMPRRPPMPEPPPRRRRGTTRTERFRMWRTTGPRGEVTTVQVAERVMRARGESVCSRCRTTVLTGQQIGLVAGEWVHVACLLGRQLSGR